MKALIGLFQRFNSQQAKHEIEDELRFHLDLLTDEHCRQAMTPDEARSKAEERFGNFDQIRDECVEISTRSSLQTRALKWLLILIFLTGVVVHGLAIEYRVTRIGDLLMMIGLLGRLLVYVRGLHRSNLSEATDTSPLKLNDSQMSFTAYDQRMRTPVERVISHK
ncbi:MAG: permease prefix domain 1-containing protein [Pyrinomonadaceae bacterium]